MSGTDDLRARIDALFPQIEAGLVTPVGTGWTVDTFDVDGEWIVQLPRSGYAAGRLRAQIDVLPELAQELSALVPLPVYVSRDEPAMAYRKLEGMPLDRAPDGLWPERLGRFLYDLHTMPPEYAGLRGRTASDVRGEAAAELDRFRVDVVPLLEPGEQVAVEAGFAAYLDDDVHWRFAPCLVHGDIGPEHVLVKDSGDLVGVLDWEDLSVNDPVGDFAWLLHARPSDGRRALAAYGGAPDATFLDRARFHFALMPFHEVIYGLEASKDAFVGSGIEGIRSRLDAMSSR